ncbi:hypothetical protein [uncultured Nitratireductor sp.]|uniref:hypothetical protein n=1 Tax=uncultured Nitratireductor sp. TaxID=520953 RepID=UPI0025E89455|nr:hypothetical protein [uncultured Nitratireductor sp.]
MKDDQATAARLEIRAIERRRKDLNLTKDHMDRAANLTRGHYHRLVSGVCTPRPSTLARLKAATLNAGKRRTAAHNDDEGLSISYQLAIALVANALGRDAASIHGQDPSRRATHNPEWMAAAEVRRIALYLLNAAAGWNQAKAAEAAGVTRQAVHTACKAIEDRRNERSFDRLLDDLTRSITGDW